MIFEHKKVSLEEFGALKTFTSREIGNSFISIGFECLDRKMFDPEKCYDLLGASGVKWARCQTGWNRCENQKEIYDFAWLDAIVDELLQRGVQPWFNVGYGNKLYMTGLYSDAAVGFVPLYFGEETLQAWKNYVRALAKHFKGRVTDFEIWNESNIGGFWQPRGADPLDYAKLIKLSADEIRKEIPDAKIGACVSGGTRWWNNGFAQRLLRSGIARDLNFFCMHAYCIQPELNYRQSLAMLRRILDANDGAHVELWQGEAGYASWFPENHHLSPYVRESQRNQSVWMLRRYFLDCALGLKRSSFFQMADMKNNYKMANFTKKNPARHGLLDGETYLPKQSYQTMRHLTAFFKDGMKPAELYCVARLDDVYPRSERHSRLVDIAVQNNAYVRDGHPFFEYHLAEDMQYDFQGIAPISILTEKNPDLKAIDKPVLIDMLTGKTYHIKNWNTDKYNELYYFHELPLTDYPLVICDETALP
ncbi:MAG: hypothetical protein IKP00_03215 [Victivallales bacterium]|nr:hypothetical protein [Victivallales bacterium]